MRGGPTATKRKSAQRETSVASEPEVSHDPEASREREIVVRIRRAAKPPWRLERALGWAVTTVAGDPVLLLLPAMTLAALVTVALAIGAPGRPEVLVPLLVLPPADSFQDLGVVRLSDASGAGAWALHAGLAAARTLFFATLVALVVRRERGEQPSLPEARRAVLRRVRVYAPLGALSFGFSLLLSQQSGLDPGRDATVAATALAAGMLVLPGTFAAAAVRGSGLWRSLASGLGFPKPLGHVVLVVGYGAAVNGLYRLATFGEPGRPRALPVTLYAFATAVLTTVVAATIVRRYALLRGPLSGSEPT